MLGGGVRTICHVEMVTAYDFRVKLPSEGL